MREQRDGLLKNPAEVITVGVALTIVAATIVTGVRGAGGGQAEVAHQAGATHQSEDAKARIVGAYVARSSSAASTQTWERGDQGSRRTGTLPGAPQSPWTTDPSAVPLPGGISWQDGFPPAPMVGATPAGPPVPGGGSTPSAPSSPAPSSSAPGTPSSPAPSPSPSSPPVTTEPSPTPSTPTTTPTGGQSETGTPDSGTTPAPGSTGTVQQPDSAPVDAGTTQQPATTTTATPLDDGV